MAKFGAASFFMLWVLLYGGAVALVILNTKVDAWKEASPGNQAHAISVLVCICVLLIDITECLAKSLVTVCLLCSCCWKDRYKEEDASNVMCIISYNLLAYNKSHIDDCYANMYRAYMGNISENVCAVLVSAARDSELKEYELQCRDRYRALIFHELQMEGSAFLEENFSKIPLTRFENLWEVIEKRYGWWYVHDNLNFICKRLSFEFMCVHRVSRVLKKCGQYQDLMMLNEGYLTAFTYTDRDLYGIYARDGSREMFQSSEDVRNIFGRGYDYTLVMDGDSEIKPGNLHRLLRIAAGNSHRTIFQPAIEFDAVTCQDTLFMALQKIRQQFAAPYLSVMGSIFNQCGFFGKGLIHNKSYIQKVIGKSCNLLEKIPINVLSHATYEAAILKPLYVSTVSFAEKPPYNYLSWNSRVRRWNLGDLKLAMHFFCCIGGPIRLLQRCVQRGRYKRTRLRTPLTMDFCTFYICSISVRAMFVKPIWLIYLILHATLPHHIFIDHYLPFIFTIATITLVPKVASVLKRPKTILFLIPEILASIIQFTAEVMVGTVRLVRIFVALLQERYEWLPQRFVEEEFSTTTNVCRIFLQSFKHLWGYTLSGVTLACAVISTGFAEWILDMRVLLYFNIATITVLPIFCFVTSLRCGRDIRKRGPKNLYKTTIQETHGYDPQRKRDAGVTLVGARTIGIEMTYPKEAMYKRASRLQQAWAFSDIDASNSRKFSVHGPVTRSTLCAGISLPHPDSDNDDKAPDLVPVADPVASYEMLPRCNACSLRGNPIRLHELKVTVRPVAPSSAGSLESGLASNITQQPNLVRHQKLSKYMYANTKDLFYIPSAIEEIKATTRDLDTIYSEESSILSTLGPQDYRDHLKSNEPGLPDAERRGQDGAFTKDPKDILAELYGSDAFNSSLSSLDGSLFRQRYSAGEAALSHSSTESSSPSILDSETSNYSSEEDNQTVQGTYSTDIESEEEVSQILTAVTVPMPELDKPTTKENPLFCNGRGSPMRRPLTTDSLSDALSIESPGSHSDWDRIRVYTSYSSFSETDCDSLRSRSSTGSSSYSPLSSVRSWPSLKESTRRRRNSDSLVTSASNIGGLNSSPSVSKRLNHRLRSFIPSGSPWPKKRCYNPSLMAPTKHLKRDGSGRPLGQISDYNNKDRLFGKVEKRERIFKQMYLPPDTRPSLERQKVVKFQLGTI
ncbi:uncharacterized protein LOC135494105 [Lineus longissimus]|uniref:uncharacterized protein LOC135494105 n=1 Tax=Lineus longissimus TaxID=88925 RepID=UPI00315D3D22